jgi:3-oxoadipate enol-lactonase
MPKTHINGADLHYRIEGSGIPLILVHGLGMDRTMWDLQVPVFSQDYQVITYDLRGHGLSEAPDHLTSIDLFADDLDQLLHFLGLRKAAVIGLSLGGRIAMRFSLKYPRQVQALILADAQSETPPESAERFRNLAQVARREGMAKTAEVFFSIPSLQGLAKRKPARWEKEKKRFLQTSVAGWANTCLAIAEMKPMNDQLSAISTPTLALAGEEDEPYLRYLDLYLQEIPRCRKEVILQASHMCNLENPEAFNQIVLSFLKGLERI